MGIERAKKWWGARLLRQPRASVPIGDIRVNFRLQPRIYFRDNGVSFLLQCPFWAAVTRRLD
jgi:hypothetical protein